MDPSPHQHRVREVFDQLVGLDPPDRERTLTALRSSEPLVADEAERLVRRATTDSIEPLFVIDTDGFHADDRTAPYAPIGEILQTPIGPVRVERMLSDPSRVGFTEVYETAHADAGRLAVKIVRQGIVGREARRRFVLEAEALRSFDHPHIARLLGAGMIRRADDEGAPGLVTPYIRGSTLDAWALDRSVEDIARVMEIVARAVHALHQRPILHRDLKPSNIIVGEDDRPVVIDLGVAKFLGDPNSDLVSFGHTVAGTPRYMAPEQFTPSTTPVDVRADIYALGAVLHELVTGEPLVDVSGCSEAEALGRKLRALTTAPRGLGTRSQVLRVAHAAAQPRASDRYPSAEAMAEDLARARSGRPITARPVGAAQRGLMLARRHPWPTMAIIATLLSAIAGSVVYVVTQQQIAQAKQRAESRFDDTRRFARWVIYDLVDRLGNLPGTSETRRLLIEEASRTLDALSADPVAGDDLLIELAEAYVRLGEVLNLELGDLPAALRQYEAANGLLARHSDPAHPVRVMVTEWIGHEAVHAFDEVETPTSMTPVTERVISVFDRIEPDLIDDHRLYRWRSRALMLYSRRMLDMNSPVEQIREVLLRSIADADRAAVLAPHDPFAVAQPAHSRFWFAHALHDLDEHDALEAADRAVEIARQTETLGHPLGLQLTARAMSLRCRELASRNDMEQFTREAPLAVEESRRALARDPNNKAVVRSAEVMRMMLAFAAIDAAERGFPAPLDLAEQWGDEGIAMFVERRRRGWSTRYEDIHYPRTYQRFLERLAALRASGD